jgi:hypothetical protein
LALSSSEWSGAYEAPTSLDGQRLIGVHPRRATFWTMGTTGVVILLVVLALVTQHPFLIVPVGLVIIVGRFMAQPLALRTPEYWFRAWLRHRRIPRDMESVSADLNAPRGVVEVETLNLRMTDDDTLASYVKRLHAFYLGLRFPVQVVVRAWPNEVTVARRWFLAVTAPTPEILAERLREIESGLSRAGLGGRSLNGDLFDTLQVCWTPKARGDRLGPYKITRERDYVVCDGEYVRGLLLSKTPRTIDANWLAGVLDGELAADFSMWLEPLDNAGELQALAERINEWETAQQLNVGVNGSNGRLGYRDPDLDDQINDAKRTRLLLRRRQLRVFLATIGFVVRGPTLAACQERERLLVDLLREHVGDDPVLPIDYEQDKAPLLAVPLGEPAVQFPLRLVSPALARTYAFSNSSVSMAGGISCGTSIGSRRENRLNLFAQTAWHMIVAGTTGAGKGFWIKCFLWRLLHAYDWQDQVNVWIIQSEKDEYTALAEAMQPDELGATAEVVRLDRLDDLAWLAYPWSGMLMPFRQLVVFDLTHMPSEDKGRAIARLLGMIERTAATRRRPKHSVVVIDELGIVLRDDEALRAIDTAYRRFRSIPRDDNPREVNRISMIGMTQRPSDLLKNQRARVLADLAEVHLYLRQKAQEIRTVKSELHMSEDEITFLETAENGGALLTCGRARVGLKIEADETERGFAYT